MCVCGFFLSVKFATFDKLKPSNLLKISNKIITPECFLTELYCFVYRAWSLTGTRLQVSSRARSSSEQLTPLSTQVWHKSTEFRATPPSSTSLPAKRATPRNTTVAELPTTLSVGHSKGTLSIFQHQVSISPKGTLSIFQHQVSILLQPYRKEQSEFIFANPVKVFKVIRL